MGNIINLPNVTVDSVVVSNTTTRPVEAKRSTFDEKNYLNVNLDESKNETTKTIYFRPIPFINEDGSVKLCELIHTHNVKVPAEVSPNLFKNYVCLSLTESINHEKYGTKCPFCEIAEIANKNQWSETDPAKKKEYREIWKNYSAKNSVIMRGIERGKENEGVKYWKFNLRQDKTDPYNQICNLADQRRNEGLAYGRNVNIFDYNEGYDLIITITKGSEGKKGNGITITDAKFASPLSQDPEQAKAWLYDGKKWTDVFGVKDYNYLTLIAKGKVPFYDKQAGKWIDKAERDNNQAAQNNAANANIAEAQAEYQQNPYQQQYTAPEPQYPQYYQNEMMINNDTLPY